MYKAKHQPSGQEILILDPRWRGQIAYLRGLDRQDALVCPGCDEPVRVRAGAVKRPHFAHKHLQNCPYERASARLLQTRAVLYDWLITKFLPESVGVEKQLDPSTGVRPFDCWVAQDDHVFTYWIFDRRMPPDERQNLKSLCARHSLHVHWIFLMDLLRVDEIVPQSRLHLTTTERAFIQQSELDQAWQTHFEQLGGGLHYLDPDQLALISYRNLTLVHEPQLYSGKRLQNPLGEVLASSISGEFVHPGEIERLASTRQKMAVERRQAEERRQKAADFLKGASLSKTPSSQGKPSPVNAAFERSGTCRVCGVRTTDWVTYFGDSQECICRACKDRG
jgi:hypothetical protein